MLKKMELTKEGDSIFIEKSNGTLVNYYLFPEFEVHKNTLLPGTVQDWHKHSEIEEIIFSISGKIEIETIETEKNIIKRTSISPNELVRIGNSIHRILNSTKEEVQFIVFRFVPDGIDKSTLIKNDKVDCEAFVKEYLTKENYFEDK